MCAVARNVLLSQLTLIPAVLQLEKHVEDGALRSLIIEGNADLPAAGILAQDYDLVLLSHGCFAKENQRGGFDSASTTSRPRKCCAFGLACRKDKPPHPAADHRFLCRADVGCNEGEQCASTPPASPLVRVRCVALSSS